MRDPIADHKTALVLGGLRDIATRFVIEWIDDPDQEHLVTEVRHVHKAFPQLRRDRTIQFIRSRAIRALTPDGGFTTPPGSRLGLLCRIIEAGMASVDWDSVAEHAIKGQNEEGK